MSLRTRPWIVSVPLALRLKGIRHGVLRNAADVVDGVLLKARRRRPLDAQVMQPEVPPYAPVRPVREAELVQLLDLYAHLHPHDPPLALNDELLEKWRLICGDPNLVHLAVGLDGRLVASCVLAVIANLTRTARPFAVVENVVTHPDYRRRGFGTAVLQQAIEIARSRRCYKIMLLTGSKRPETLRFYERVGFEPYVKTGFVMRLD